MTISSTIARGGAPLPGSASPYSRGAQAVMPSGLAQATMTDGSCRAARIIATDGVTARPPCSLCWLARSSRDISRSSANAFIEARPGTVIPAHHRSSSPSSGTWLSPPSAYSSPEVSGGSSTPPYRVAAVSSCSVSDSAAVSSAMPPLSVVSARL